MPNDIFLQYISHARNYRDMHEVNESLHKVRDDMGRNPLPAAICPLIVIITGSGNCSQVFTHAALMKRVAIHRWQLMIGSTTAF